jgi:hypothetical protein
MPDRPEDALLGALPVALAAVRAEERGSGWLGLPNKVSASKKKVSPRPGANRELAQPPHGTRVAGALKKPKKRTSSRAAFFCREVDL